MTDKVRGKWKGFTLRPSLIAVAVFLAASGMSHGQTPAEVTVLPRIVDTLCIDLVEDLNGCETVVLLTSEVEPDAVDLVIFTDRRGAAGAQILDIARHIAFDGAFFGQAPSLDRASSGALLLQSEQVAVGRTPWTQTLTIVHRDGAFVIAGQTYSTYDRATGGSFSCDVNFLTGEWVTSAERPNPETDEIVYGADDAGQIDPARVPLADWSWATDLPATCTQALNDWFDAAP